MQVFQKTEASVCHPKTEASARHFDMLMGKSTVSAERLELSTNGLKGHCSTIELRAHQRRKRTAFYHDQVTSST